MKRIWIAVATTTALTALAASQAAAADLPQVDGLYSPQGPAAQMSWEGAYVGAQIGAGQASTQVKATGVKKTFSDNGIATGLYAGYNWQFSDFVVGLEADATFNPTKKSITNATLGKVTAKSTWSAGVKGRVGLAVDNFMPYLSAGLVASDYKMIANNVTKKSKNVSLSLGGGLEYALDENIRLRADYSLMGLRNKRENFGGTSVKTSAGQHRLMVGMSYNF